MLVLEESGLHTWVSHNMSEQQTVVTNADYNDADDTRIDKSNNYWKGPQEVF